MFMRGYLDAHEIATREVWIADRFRVEPAPSEAVFGWSDLNTVRDGFARFGLLDACVRFLQGPPGEALADAAHQADRIAPHRFR